MPLRFNSLLNVQAYMPNGTVSAEVEGDGFWIGLYEAERFMHIVPRGKWTIERATSYRRCLRAATNRMMRAGSYQGAVFDASVYPAQDTDVMRQHSAAMRTARWIYNVKASVYSPHPIIGRQLEAATVEGYQRSFGNATDAMDWLFT